MTRFARNSLAALLLATATSVPAAPFTGLTVFGDSLSDTGNAAIALGGAVTMPPFPLIPSEPYARPGPLLPALSNGPIWAEFVASALKLPPDAAGRPLAPALAGGSNFAFGGADTGPLSTGPLTPNVPPSGSPTLLNQFDQFQLSSGPIVPTDLYAVWGGGNDIRRALDVYSDVLMTSMDPAAALAAASAVIASSVANLSTLLGSLAAGGAQHILSLNAPDLGITPAVKALGADAVSLATGLSEALNIGLGTAILAIENNFSIDIVEVNLFKVLEPVVTDPNAFGLLNVTDPCLQVGGSGICADPASFLFWDGIHPTLAGHRLIAGAVLTALIPEPRTAGLLVIGLLAGLLVRRLAQR